MNPLNRLLKDAEGQITALTRRAVESAVAPVKAKTQEIVADTLGTVTAAARALAVKAALGLFAVVMLIIAICYGMSAAYQKLAVLLGPIEATLVMAGGFLLLAVIALVAIALVPGRPAAKPQQAAPVEHVAASPLLSEDSVRTADHTDGSYAHMVDPPAHPSDTEMALRSGLDAVVTALGEAGYTREQAGLRAGLAIARQLRPMQVASLALLGGFIAGVRLTGRRRRRPRSE